MQAGAPQAALKWRRASWLPQLARSMQQTMQHTTARVDRQPVVLLIGAGLGVLATIAAQAGARVVVVEPCHLQQTQLHAVLAANGAAPAEHVEASLELLRLRMPEVLELRPTSLVVSCVDGGSGGGGCNSLRSPGPGSALFTTRATTV